MTDKALEKIGILPDKSRLNPNRYWCNATQEHMNISRNMWGEDIMQDIFDNAFNQGVEEGKERRSKEFKRLINNE